VDTDGTVTALHTFSGSDGAYPYAALVPGSDGALYGTANSGGPNGAGVVFRSGEDSDGDGVLDGVDNCLDVPNADQADANHDDFGDACTVACDFTGDHTVGVTRFPRGGPTFRPERASGHARRLHRRRHRGGT